MRTRMPMRSGRIRTWRPPSAIAMGLARDKLICGTTRNTIQKSTMRIKTLTMDSVRITEIKTSTRNSTAKDLRADMKTHFIARDDNAQEIARRFSTKKGAPGEREPPFFLHTELIWGPSWPVGAIMRFE